MTKKFCLSHLISQEPYIIWLSFTLHLSKMISLDNFFIFCKFWFFGLLVGKRTKNSPKWQKFLSIALHIWGTIHHVTVIYVCKMIISSSSGIFSIFLKILTLRGSERAKSDPEWQKIRSVTLHISGTIHHMIVICGANV